VNTLVTPRPTQAEVQRALTTGARWSAMCDHGVPLVLASKRNRKLAQGS
jgi:hypothetical protein